MPEAAVLGSELPKTALKEPFQNPDGALFPRHPVRDARGVLELAQVLQVPAEVPEQGLLVRELGHEVQLSLCSLNGDEGVFGGRLVDPVVEGGELQPVED